MDLRDDLARPHPFDDVQHAVRDLVVQSIRDVNYVSVLKESHGPWNGYYRI